MESPGHTRSTNYAAFLLPGLLGLNLLTMGLFSVGMVTVSYREKGKFRRLAVTPLPKWAFLGGQVLHRLTIVVIQSTLLLLVGWFFFGIVNQGSYASFAVVVFLGTACFMAFGFALSSFAQTTEAYAAISNLCFFPMMLLSGVYFTLDSAPRWLQTAVIACRSRRTSRRCAPCSTTARGSASTASASCSSRSGRWPPSASP
jgi:ABC-type multidrug transport system permease subunit